jgi:hypothetical protein
MAAERSGGANPRGLALCVAAPLLLIVASGLSAKETTGTGEGPSLEARQASDGILLLEDGRPALFYRTRPAPGAESWRVNYIHPLWSVSGVELTEDAPPDHVPHRGVFWAWRRILVDGVQVADGWVGSGLQVDVVAATAQVLADGSAEIVATSHWTAPVGGRPEQIVEETAQIRLHPVNQGRRRLDVTLTLRALRQGVAIGGTTDEKGYGGPSIRLGHADELDIFSDDHPLFATVGPVRTGPSLQFTWRRGFPGWAQRVVASCAVDGRPWTSWILRQEPSMQNCAFPGREPFEIPVAGGLQLRLTVTHD